MDWKRSSFLRCDLRMQRLQYGIKGSYEEVCSSRLLHPIHLGNGARMDLA